MELKHYKIARIALVIFAGFAVCFALSFGTHAQSTKTITEWTVPTANSQPAHVTPTAGSAVFFTEMGANKIGTLNFTSNNISEWALSPKVSPHGVAVLGAAAVFAEEAGRIGLLDTTTNKLKLWFLRTHPSSPSHVVPQGTSTVFFTDAGANAIGMLNVSTNKVTEWPVPTANAALNGISITSTGTLWFAEGVGKIAVLNPTTNVISEVTLPLGATGLSSPGHIIVVANQIFFNDSAANTLGRFNTSTNVLTEWTVPTVNSVPAAVLAVQGTLPLIQFDEMAGNKVGTLNSSTAGTNTTIVPVATTVTPTTITIGPVNTTLTKTVTTVTPVVTSVAGVVTGGFTEFAVPTAASGPLGMGNLTSGAVIFAEFSGNKIGQIK